MFSLPAEGWDNMLEAYELIPENNGTTLKVDFHTTEEYKEFMTNTFEKSLRIIKRLAEA